jgi:DNA topoisomerase-1
VDLIARKMASVRTLGVHPADQELVAVRKGRFGPYAQHGKMVANLPRGVMMEDITLDQAVALLAEKGKQLRPRGSAGRRGRGAAAPNPEPPAETKAPATRKAKPAERRPAKAKRATPKKTAKSPAKKKAAARARKSAARLH